MAQASAKKATLSPLVREVSLPSVEMRVEEAMMRFFDFGRAPRDSDFLKKTLEAARSEAERLTAGEDPYKDRTGAFTKAYRSAVDDTLQPYALYVPRSYDPTKAYPLLVTLHGATSNHLLNRRRVFGLGNRPGESDYEAIRNDVELSRARLHRRGSLRPRRGGGLQRDRRRATCCGSWTTCSRAYNVDPDRVHLTGLSMGGGGTWQIGLRHPDRFASISPVCAVASLNMFPWAAARRPLDKELGELTSAMAVAENASNQQVFIFHGDEDPAVPVEQSRKMVEIYSGLGWLGKSVHYFELPGVHHFAWDFSYRERIALRPHPRRPPEPLPRACRLQDPLRPLQHGLLAAHRPHRPRHDRSLASRGGAQTARSRSRPTTSRPSPSCSSPRSLPRASRWR